MAKDALSQNYGGATWRFWRNVVLITLAHVALIAGLIHWSLAAKTSSEPANIMWLDKAGDVAASQSESEPSPAGTPATPPVQPRPLKEDEAEEEKAAATNLKIEIEMRSRIPKATPSPTLRPKPSTTPKPKPNRTPRLVPRPTPKRTLARKTSAKASRQEKQASKKTSEKLGKLNGKTLAKMDSASQSAGTKTGLTGKKGSADGGSVASEFAWYGSMLHDRFYRAWIQPTVNAGSTSKSSTLVRIRIEKDGRVSKFEIIQPSQNIVVNESVRLIARQVTHVDPPPTGLIKGDHYDVRINFELNTEEKSEN